MELMEKPLISATLGDFVEALKLSNPQAEEPQRLAYGIAGLATLLNCSIPTAQKLKNSGDVPYMQQGRKIVFDINKVLEAIEHK
ncbi:MAG: DUF3853 family protein [Bacteroidales bacterium]|nr:DUF3853 family protein [Bacteroidales bacterium]